jgi:hypothetical protein
MAEPASEEYLKADQEDAQLALVQAVTVGATGTWPFPSTPILEFAGEFYRFLRRRESLTPARLVLQAGPPEAQPAYATTGGT